MAVHFLLKFREKWTRVVRLNWSRGSVTSLLQACVSPPLPTCCTEGRDSGVVEVQAVLDQCKVPSRPHQVATALVPTWTCQRLHKIDK